MRLPQGGPHRPCCISRCAPQRTDRRRRCARGSRLASGRDLPRCTWGTAAPTATASRPHARLEQRWSVRCGRGPGRTFWRGRSRPRRIVSSGETSACELGRGLSRQQAAGTSAGRPRGRQVNCTQQRAGGTSPLSLVRARRPATSEGSFRLVRPRSGRVGGVWAAFMCLHWRSVLSSGSLPAAPALEVGRQRNGRHFRVEWPPRGRIGRGRVRLAGPTRCWPTSHSAPPRSHSARRALPLGASRLPTGTPSGRRHVPVGGRVGLSNCDSKSEWEHGGAAASPHWVPRGWRGALAGSHSPARGALRVRPLGGRATTVCAPLPLGDLPRK